MANNVENLLQKSRFQPPPRSADCACTFALAAGLVPGRVLPADVIRLKRETRTTLSYQAMVKRLDFLGYAETASFKGVKWKKLEEGLFGEPLYKRLLRRRRSR